jgi:hypothetical protein
MENVDLRVLKAFLRASGDKIEKYTLNLNKKVSASSSILAQPPPQIEGKKILKIVNKYLVDITGIDEVV